MEIYESHYDFFHNTDLREIGFFCSLPVLKKSEFNFSPTMRLCKEDEETFEDLEIWQLAIKLAEDIYGVLAERAGAPVARGVDIAQAIAEIEAAIRDDTLMYSIVKKLRPKYDDIKIKGVVLAFRKAYALGHFEELQGMFAT